MASCGLSTRPGQLNVKSNPLKAVSGKSKVPSKPYDRPCDSSSRCPCSLCTRNWALHLDDSSSPLSGPLTPLTSSFDMESPERHPKAKTIVVRADQANDKVEEEDPIKWCEAHNDPTAKVVLISKERTHYRVAKWYISKKSEFFRGLISVPSDVSLDKSPIETDLDDHAMKVAISIIYGNPSPNPHRLSYDALESLLEFSQKFEFPAIHAVAIDGLCDYAILHKDSWKAFRLASQYNVPRLALAVLRSFDRGTGSLDRERPLTDTQGLTGEHIRSVNPDWLALIWSERMGTLVEKGNKSGNRTGEVHEVRSWTHVANKFKEMFVKKEGRAGGLGRHGEF